jgi:putative hydrolase of the HAD superfamily
MKKALARAGLDQYFQHFYGVSDLEVSKPNPLFFTNILRLSGFLPDETMAIGNLYEKDVVSANRAGLRTIFFNENGLPGKFPEASHVIRKMSQLPELILSTTSGT